MPGALTETRQVGEGLGGVAGEVGGGAAQDEGDTGPFRGFFSSCFEIYHSASSTFI